MQGVLAFVFAITIVIVVVWAGVEVYRRYHKRADNRTTATGETFNERQAYHARGELSHGEQLLAQQIRGSLPQEESSEQARSARTVGHWLIDEQEVLDIIISEGYRYAPTQLIFDVSEGGWYDSDYPIAFNGKRGSLRSYGTHLSALSPQEREAKKVAKFDQRFVEEPSSQE